MNVSEFGRSIITEESQALTALANSLGEDFERAVRAIAALPRTQKVLTTGIGKTGLVAQKLSATLASVGVPSFFVHPAEAYHGDLGRFERGDIVVAFSASGESIEVVRLLPFLKRLGTQVIGCTLHRTSRLGRTVDIALCAPPVKESGPHELAPTTSIVVLLALADALSMAVMRLRETTPDQYALLHPGGHLGLKLLAVTELMRSGNFCCVQPVHATCREVMHATAATPGRPGAASIVGDSNELTGIFTDGDLRRCLTKNTSFLDEPVAQHMGRAPKTIHPSQYAQEALKLMSEHQIDQIVVVDDGRRVLGMVDIQDLEPLK